MFPCINTMLKVMEMVKQDRSRRCKYIQSFDHFNKIAQGDVTIFSHLTFLKIVHVLFIDLTRNLSSNRLNTIKFVIYGSELVEIDTLLARF